jgi:hypothetical protein
MTRRDDPVTNDGDRGSNRAQGETHGQAQEPVEAGERDTVQQEQAQREGRPAGHDPSVPDAEVEDSLRMAHSPDATYGQREDQG